MTAKPAAAGSGSLADRLRGVLSGLAEDATPAKLVATAAASHGDFVPKTSAERALMRKACAAVLKYTSMCVPSDAKGTTRLLALTGDMIDALVQQQQAPSNSPTTTESTVKASATAAAAVAMECMAVAQLANTRVGILAASRDYEGGLAACDTALHCLSSTPCNELAAAALGGGSHASIASDEGGKENLGKGGGGGGGGGNRSVTSSSVAQYAQLRGVIALRRVQMCARARDAKAICQLGKFTFEQTMPWLQVLPVSPAGGSGPSTRKRHMATLAKALGETRNLLHRQRNALPLLNLVRAHSAARYSAGEPLATVATEAIGVVKSVRLEWLRRKEDVVAVGERIGLLFTWLCNAAAAAAASTENLYICDTAATAVDIDLVAGGMLVFRVTEALAGECARFGDTERAANMLGDLSTAWTGIDSLLATSAGLHREAVRLQAGGDNWSSAVEVATAFVDAASNGKLSNAPTDAIRRAASAVRALCRVLEAPDTLLSDTSSAVRSAMDTALAGCTAELTDAQSYAEAGACLRSRALLVASDLSVTGAVAAAKLLTKAANLLRKDVKGMRLVEQTAFNMGLRLFQANTHAGATSLLRLACKLCALVYAESPATLPKVVKRHCLLMEAQLQSKGGSKCAAAAANTLIDALSLVLGANFGNDEDKTAADALVEELWCRYVNVFGRCGGEVHNAANADVCDMSSSTTLDNPIAALRAHARTSTLPVARLRDAAQSLADVCAAHGGSPALRRLHLNATSSLFDLLESEKKDVASAGDMPTVATLEWERARLLVHRAQILRLGGSDGVSAAVLDCKDAVSTVEKVMATEEGCAANVHALDDAACAHLWYGICLHDAGQPSNEAFGAALRLWQRLAEPGGTETDGPPSAHVRDPVRTQEQLTLLASLFRLLDQTRNAVMVHDLVAALSARMCVDSDMHAAAVVTAARSHASAGHSIGLLGYVGSAENYFERADSALAELGNKKTRESTRRTVDIFRSTHLLAKNSAHEAVEMLEAALEAHRNEARGTGAYASDCSGTSSVAYAAATSALADGHLGLGQPHHATVAAHEAYRVRAQGHVRATRRVIRQHAAAADDTATSSSIANEECEVIDAATAAAEMDKEAEEAEAASAAATEAAEDPGRKAALPPAADPTYGIVVSHAQWDVLADFFTSLHQLGTLHEMQGMYRRAAFYFRRGLHYATGNGGGALVNVRARFHLSLAALRCHGGEYDAAAKHLESAQECVDSYKAGGCDPYLQGRDAARVARGRGDLSLARGAFHEALAFYEAAEAHLRALTEAPYDSGVEGGSAPVLDSTATTGSRKVGDRSSHKKGPVARVRASVAPPKEGVATPGTRARINPLLGSALSSVLAARAWAATLAGQDVDAKVLKDARRLAVRPADVAALHYYQARITLSRAPGGAAALLSALWSAAPTTADAIDGDSVAVSAAVVGSLETAFAAEAEEEAEVKDVPSPIANVTKLKVVELRAALKARGLNTRGLRRDLLARLQVALAEEAKASPKPTLNVAAAASEAATAAAAAGIKASAKNKSAESNIGVALPPSRTTSSEAEDHLVRAFESSRQLGLPTLVSHTGLLLAQTQGRCRQMRAAMYQHMALGISACQAASVRLATAVRKAATTPPDAVAKRKKANSATKKKAKEEGDRLDLYTFAGVCDEAAFVSRYVNSLPDELTVVGLSIDTEANAVLVSRLRRGGDALVRRVTPDAIELVAALGSESAAGVVGDNGCGGCPGSSEGPILSILRAYSRVQKDNREVISMSTETESDKIAWWDKRHELDARLEYLASTTEDVLLAEAKALLLGAHENSDFAAALARHTKEACDELRTLVKQSCGANIAAAAVCTATIEACLDAGQEGVLTEPQFRALVAAAAGGFLGNLDEAVELMLAHCEDLVEAALPIRRELAAVLPSFVPPPRAAATGASVAAVSGSGGGITAAPQRTPRVKKAFGRRGGGGGGGGASNSIDGIPKTPRHAFAPQAPLLDHVMATPLRTSSGVPPPTTPFRTPMRTPRRVTAAQIQQQQQQKIAAITASTSGGNSSATTTTDASTLPRLRRRAVVLVLSKGIQNLPLESMPVMQRLPVTRMPALPFVVDNSGSGSANGSTQQRRVLNPKSVYYVLNPSRDLVQTQQRFETRFAAQTGWRGVAGTAPSRAEYAEALTQRDIVVYCGHGTGQAYCSAADLERAQCRSTMLLMGCSSGLLRDQGAYEPSGMALSYVIAGAPAVVANLWDVTDRDIDRFTGAMLTHWLAPSPPHPAAAALTASLPAVVASAREACTLPYLNGAAPVVYGMPVTMGA